MKLSEAYAFMVGMVGATIIGLWFGMAVGLQACVNRADSGYQHPLYKESIVCEVKK